MGYSLEEEEEPLPKAITPRKPVSYTPAHAGHCKRGVRDIHNSKR